MNAHCAAIDWGTTSFRIWLIAEDATVLAERRSDEGMSAAAKTGFADIMEAHLQAMQAPANLPVIICGMAGARQGWQEAPYLALPVRLVDVLDRAITVESSQRDIRILPGLAQHDPERPDVMRGEETQLLDGFAAADASGVACLPGTHSKWVRIAAGQVTDVSTYMTGELFGLIARQSILRHAVGDIETCEPGSDTFAKAVVEAADNPAAVSRLLFSIRAGQLLIGCDERSSYTRLSGLLIGWEIAAARIEYGSKDPIHLIASGALSALYGAAFGLLGMNIVNRNADEAVLNGLVAGARRFWPMDPEKHGRMNA